MLKAKTEKLGVKEYVKFLGKIRHRDVAKYLEASDIYVSTSLSDGTSASLLEAMALSLPVVVTDIPGNREWVKNGWNGFLFPAKNPEKLAEKVVVLAKDKNTINQACTNFIRSYIWW